MVKHKWIIKKPLISDKADLERWTMNYQDISLILHRKSDGYTVSFVWDHILYNTAQVLTQQLALEVAKQMIGDLV